MTLADGNEDGLRDTAIRNARALGCGHNGVGILDEKQDGARLGHFRIAFKTLIVIDGSPPKGVEGQADVAWRHGLFRNRCPEWVVLDSILERSGQWS